MNNENPSKFSVSISSAINSNFGWFLFQDFIITICIYFLFHYKIKTTVDHLNIRYKVYGM